MKRGLKEGMLAEWRRDFNVGLDEKRIERNLVRVRRYDLG